MLFGKYKLNRNQNYVLLNNRSQDNAQTQGQNAQQADNGVRLVKTSEDRYERSDSSSSRSNIAEETKTARSNINIPPSIHQQQTIKPDYNRVFIRSIEFIFRHIFLLVDFSRSKNSIIG